MISNCTIKFKFFMRYIFKVYLFGVININIFIYIFDKVAFVTKEFGKEKYLPRLKSFCGSCLMMQFSRRRT